VAAARLVGGEGDRPTGDVGISADLVRVGVVAVVFGDPPAVAEPDQRVAVDPADQVIGALGAGDRAMAGTIRQLHAADVMYPAA
jgi:sugar/nucleoside kinase (ribokinase family)